MKKAIIAVIVVVVLAAGGWLMFDQNKSTDKTNTGSATESNTNSSIPSQDQSVVSTGSIDIKNMMFTPPQISIKKGGTVTWTNNDSVVHTVTDDLTDVGGPSSTDIQPGSTYTFTFNKTGSFQYHCTYHPSMRGTIVVE